MKRSRPNIMNVLGGAWYGQAVYVAAKLGIADMLVDGPQTAEDLARNAGVDEVALRRVLRALASMGIFLIREDGKVELTEEAEPLGSNHPNSVRSFAIMVNEEFFEAFGHFMETVKTGRPAFDQRFGMSVFEYYDSHPQAAATFHAAMSNWSKWDTPDIIEAYDFSRFNKVVDLGGGNGAFLSALLNRYSNLSGVLLDRPMGVEAARQGLGGSLPRCEIVAGDFLADVPKGADLYTIKHVLDAWQDEDVIKLFSNCRASMANGGRVVVLESVIEPGNNPSLIKWLDLMMMTVADGGKFRSEPDFPPLFAEAGLRLNQVVRISDSVTLLEAVAA